jgi:PAS domain S-box-containing protein
MNNFAGESLKAPNRRGHRARSIPPRLPASRTNEVAAALRLLLVENCIHDELEIINQLHCGGFEVSHKRVETMADFQAALNEKAWDLILCDYYLCGSERLTLLQLCQKRGLDIPFIIVSAAMGEDLAVEVLKAGANDYVMKQNLSRLVPAINRELRAAQERQIRRRTEAAQAYLASVVESCHDAIIGQTIDGTVVTWNHGAERLYGYSASEMIGRSASVLIPWYRPEAFDNALEALNRGEPVENSATIRIRKDGSEVEVSVSVSPVKDAAGRIIGASTVARDMTRWKQEENERLDLIQELTSALAMQSVVGVTRGKVELPKS